MLIPSKCKYYCFKMVVSEHIYKSKFGIYISVVSSGVNLNSAGLYPSKCVSETARNVFLLMLLVLSPLKGKANIESFVL